MTKQPLPSYVVLLCFICLCGCAESRPERQSYIPAGENAVLYFYDDADNFGVSARIVSAFNNARSGVKIAGRYLSNDSYDDTLATLIMSGAADCFFIRTAAQTNRLAGMGVLSDFTQNLTHSNIDLAGFGSSLDSVSQNGRLYALPRSKSAWLLFYNQDLFDQFQLPYPTKLSWEEYAALAKALTMGRNKGGYIPLQMPNLGGAAAGEYLTDDELPYTGQYLALLYQLYNIDRSHPNIAQMQLSYANPYEWFAAGKLALMVNGDWSVALLREEAAKSGSKVRWDIAPLPTFSPKHIGTAIGRCSYMALAANGQNLETALDFLLYYCGEEGADISASLTSCPAYFTLESSERYLQSAGVAGARLFFESTLLNEESGHPLYMDVNAAFTQSAIAYLTDKQGLDQALTNFYESRKNILATE